MRMCMPAAVSTRALDEDAALQPLICMLRVCLPGWFVSCVLARVFDEIVPSPTSTSLLHRAFDESVLLQRNRLPFV